MASVLGKELMKIPIYQDSGPVSKGELLIMEGGIALVNGNQKLELPKNMVEELKVVSPLPLLRYKVLIRYIDYMGAHVSMEFVVPEREYRHLSQCLRK